MAKRHLDRESRWDIFGEGEDWRLWRQRYGKQDKVNLGFGRGYARQSGFQSVAGLEDEADLPSGPYTGFGPQGYHRTDDRIFDEVCMRLTRHGQIDASEIQVEVHDAEVTLKGTVDNRDEKKMAEEAIRDISGVREVHNQLRLSGRPGAVGKRREEVRGSGVYPASGPLPPRDAEVHGMASWGQGERGARGYFDHGESELRIEPGQFTGYGPRGYRRPDERIHEEVSERLSRHGQIDASDIEVEVRNGEVILRGTVDKRRTKRAVEDALEDVSGVQDVHNELKIRETTRQPPGYGGRSLKDKIRPGMEVVGIRGRHIGQVKEVKSGHFLVEHPDGRQVEIPLGFCKSVDEMVTLTIPADRLEKEIWRQQFEMSRKQA